MGTYGSSGVSDIIYFTVRQLRFLGIYRILWVGGGGRMSAEHTYLKEDIRAVIQLNSVVWWRLGLLITYHISSGGPTGLPALKPISPVKIRRSNEIPQIWLTPNLLYRFHFEALQLPWQTLSSSLSQKGI